MYNILCINTNMFKINNENNNYLIINNDGLFDLSLFGCHVNLDPNIEFIHELTEIKYNIFNEEYIGYFTDLSNILHYILLIKDNNLQEEYKNIYYYILNIIIDPNFPPITIINETETMYTVYLNDNRNIKIEHINSENIDYFAYHLDSIISDKELILSYIRLIIYIKLYDAILMLKIKNNNSYIRNIRNTLINK